MYYSYMTSLHDYIIKIKIQKVLTQGVSNKNKLFREKKHENKILTMAFNTYSCSYLMKSHGHFGKNNF